MASLNPLPRIHNHLPAIVLLQQLGIFGGDKVISRSVSILTSPLWPSLCSVDTAALGARPNWQKAIHFRDKQTEICSGGFKAQSHHDIFQYYDTAVKKTTLFISQTSSNYNKDKIDLFLQQNLKGIYNTQSVYITCYWW